MTTTAHRLTRLGAALLLAACSGAPAPTTTIQAASGTIPPVSGERHATGGIEYIDIVEGGGEPVRSGQCAYLHYIGWTESGRVFDTSRDTTGATMLPPLTVPLGTKLVIAGWDAGIPGMRIGGTRRLFIPYRLAYGEVGSPPMVPRRANLIFDVELVAIGHATRTATKPTCPAWR